MCALKFLRLEDFLYDRQHGQTINLEPQGILFADVCLCLLGFLVSIWLTVIFCIPVEYGKDHQLGLTEC